MICVIVPPTVPLTHQDDAMTVYVVRSENEISSVCFTLERAQQYIDDWMSQLGDLEPEEIKDLQLNRRWHWRGYEIEKTVLRF